MGAVDESPDAAAVRLARRVRLPRERFTVGVGEGEWVLYLRRSRDVREVTVYEHEGRPVRVVVGVPVVGPARKGGA